MLRRIGRILLAVAGVQAGLLAAGCGDASYKCETGQSVCGSFRLCCTDKDCYLTAGSGGQQYACNGLDCDAATLRLGLVMCADAPGTPNASTKDTAAALKQTTRELAAKAAGTRCAVCP